RATAARCRRPPEWSKDWAASGAAERSAKEQGASMSAVLAAVLALGGLAALEGLRHGMLSLSADFLLLMVFACVAAPHTLNLGHNARISTLQPFLLGAIVLFGVREAMLLAAVSMAYFWIVGRPRLHLHKGLFNLCNFV